MSFLAEIVESTQARIQREYRDYIPNPQATDAWIRRDLTKAIRGCRRVPVIGEIKSASPSKGVLREITDPEALALEMEKAGAVGLSVLTEPQYFQGDIQLLKRIQRTVNIPVLMKDFILDKRQVHHAAEVGADAILLMPAIISTVTQLEELNHVAESHGLQALVEVHDMRDVEAAARLNPKLVGINNRDLTTFEIDLKRTVRLLPHVRRSCPEAVVISESGIKSPRDIRYLMQGGAEAFLVGTYLMEGDNVGNRVKTLVEALG